MRIVLATPLYPPEIAEPAPYVKELAKRLSEHHTVTVVAYTHLPENIPGVSVVIVDKSHPLPVRLLKYFLALSRAARDADIIYAMNGPSVELPAAFLSLFTTRPIIIHLGDTAAHERARSSWLAGSIERFAFSRASAILNAAPLARPEVLPFGAYPAEQFAAYAQSWDAHLAALETMFNHAVR